MDSYNSEFYQNREEEIIDSLIDDFGTRLAEEDGQIINLTTISNCHTWGTDDYEITQAEFVSNDQIRFSVNLQLHGEQYDDLMRISDTILTEITGEATRNGDSWEISSYEVLDAGFETDFRDFEYKEAVTSNVNYFETFSDDIAGLRVLNDLVIDDVNALRILQKQMYVTAIVCLETYLLDALMNKVLSDQSFLKSFISNFDFGERKIELNKLYESVEQAEEIAKQEMSEILYHKISKVKNIYEKVLRIEFPDISSMARAVSTRHDLVHRNGRTKDGEVVPIDKAIVSKLISDVEAFVTDIDRKIRFLIEPGIAF